MVTLLLNKNVLNVVKNVLSVRYNQLIVQNAIKLESFNLNKSFQQIGILVFHQNAMMDITQM